MRLPTDLLRFCIFPHLIAFADLLALRFLQQLGPLTFTRQDHETVLTTPLPMTMIPPRHYAIISNPAERYVKRSFGLPLPLSLRS